MINDNLFAFVVSLFFFSHSRRIFYVVYISIIFLFISICVYSLVVFFQRGKRKSKENSNKRLNDLKIEEKKVKIQMKIQFSVVTFFNNRQAMLSENSTQIRSEIAMKTSILLFHAKLFKSIYHQCEKESICRSSFLSN